MAWGNGPLRVTQRKERIAIPRRTRGLSGYGAKGLENAARILEPMLQNGNADTLAFEISDQHRATFWDSVVLSGWNAARVMWVGIQSLQIAMRRHHAQVDIAGDLQCSTSRPLRETAFGKYL